MWQSVGVITSISVENQVTPISQLEFYQRLFERKESHERDAFNSIIKLCLIEPFPITLDDWITQYYDFYQLLLDFIILRVISIYDRNILYIWLIVLVQSIWNIYTTKSYLPSDEISNFIINTSGRYMKLRTN